MNLVTVLDVVEGALWAGGVLVIGIAAGAFVRSGRRE